MSQEVVDLVRGISTAAAQIGYDGALDVDGKPLEIGLKREQGHPIYDSRVMDGFNFSISGTTLILSYHADIKLKELYSQDYEAECEQIMAKVIKALKKRFKANTKKNLSLKDLGECEIDVQSTSRVRRFATAKKMYEISNMTDVENPKEPSELKLEKNFKSFLEQSAGEKKAPNDKRKSES